MQQKYLFYMLLGFTIFVGSVIGLVHLIYSAPVTVLEPTTKEQTVSQAPSEETVIEKVLPTLPPVTQKPQPTPSSVTPTVLGSTTQEKSTAQPTIDVQALYSLINAYRKENNLSTLQPHNSLQQSANKKLQEMIAEKYWQHQNKAGRSSWPLFEESGYHYSDAGENLSFGNNTPWTIFNAWVNSPDHNAQMLTPEYEDMGAAFDCVILGILSFLAMQ